MKQKIILISLLFFAVKVMAESTLLIKPCDGADKQYSCSLIGQILFKDNIMYLYDAGGIELGHTPVENIGKIVFLHQGEETSIGNVSNTIIQVFPNPSNNYIIIRGLKTEQIIRVFNMSGQLMSSIKNDSYDTQINVSELPRGYYLLQIGAEFVKFIKQ
ncbi:MAG: T9SS type A sorting domain-containing protein [Paludibacteraceae bacterium]|nr:T9SS type A sorting domain-containing protein [Paludibacteraceae bacterium]